MTTETMPVTTQSTDEKRGIALLKAVGLDKLAPEQRELALHIANRYDLDLLLKHLVIIEGRAYITRDGLLHVAHRSGVFDGIEVTPAVLDGGFWRSTASVWRKDMGRAFTYPGRYPEAGNNRKYGPEMAIKVAEVMALRRAFDVSAPAAEERFVEDVPVAQAEQPKAQSLADIAKAKLAEQDARSKEPVITDEEAAAIVDETLPIEATTEPLFSPEEDAVIDAAVRGAA